MQQPLTIVQETRHLAHQADADKHPWPYPISYAHKQIYLQGDGLVAEQCYDAKLLFLHQVELSGEIGFQIGTKSAQTDLYWFYMLQGETIISTSEKKHAASILLQQQRAYLLQLPAGQYQLRVPDVALPLVLLLLSKILVTALSGKHTPQFCQPV